MIWTLTISIPLVLIILFISRKIKAKKKEIHVKQESNNIDLKYLFLPKLISFTEDLTFTPSNKQIIYVENSYNNIVNEFIINHYEKVSLFFSKRGYSFCYLPSINEAIVTTETIKYYNPSLKKVDIDKLRENIKELTYNNLLSYTHEKDNLHTGFIRYKGKVDNNYQFSYFELIDYSEKEIWLQLHTYINLIGVGTTLYSLGKPEEDEIADSFFSYESIQLVEEIKERIEKLRKIGIKEMAIKSLFLTKPKISKILITKDFRIFLPDYNNKEIVMYPLPKAIFFLFLKHPEGILFKQLPDFKTELKHIYSNLSSRAELRDINESINNVTDPSKNAINEKCSRIREAFIKEFDESLAQYYFITGERAEPKRISIDRSLVTFESEI